jgi:nitrous oxide reductase accessory protein NosL
VTRRSVLFALAAVAALAACSKSDAPIDPVWGKQACAHCAMIVGDKRYAAQVLAEGDRFFFDDIGCMVLWTEAQKAKPVRAWVRDPQATAWVDATSARYASGAHTPMDFGFETRGEGGVGWSEMRQQVIARKKDVPR